MITGIIMASGFSKRMEKDKLKLDFYGNPMIEWVIKAVKASYVDHIIMVYRDEEIKEIGLRNGIETVYNPRAELGQSEAMKLGINFSPKETRAFMFFVGDQPLLNPNTINKLIESFRTCRYPMVVPEYKGKRGNPVIFSGVMKDELLQITGDEGGRSIINKRYHEVKIVPFDDTLIGKDLDTWDEYMKWRGSFMFDEIVIIRGGGDLATGIIQKIYRSGFKVLVLEIDKPTVIRRNVTFARAIFDGVVIVEGIKAVKVNNTNEIYDIWSQGYIPVMVDKECDILNKIKADILVDAILAKKNLGTHKGMVPITIGVGPGFTAGVDVDVVIETKRGHDLGKLIFSGTALEDTGIPGEILGYGKERLIKAPCGGKIRNLCDIGDFVKKDQIITYVDNEPVKAQIDGVLRGIIQNNSEVAKGLKIGDIDPQGIKEYCFTISDKARAIGGGVLEAILYLKKLKMEEQ